MKLKRNICITIFFVLLSPIDAFSETGSNVFIQKLSLAEKPIYSCLVISSQDFELNKYCTTHSASASGETDQKRGLFVILYEIRNLIFQPNLLYWTMHYSPDNVLTSTRVRKLKVDDLRPSVDSELIAEDIVRLENTVLQNESLLEDLKTQYNKVFVSASKSSLVVDRLKQHSHEKFNKERQDIETERKKSLLSCKDLKNDSGALNVRQELTTELKHLLGE